MQVSLAVHQSCYGACFRCRAANRRAIDGKVIDTRVTRAARVNRAKYFRRFPRELDCGQTIGFSLRFQMVGCLFTGKAQRTRRACERARQAAPQLCALRVVRYKWPFLLDQNFVGFVDFLEPDFDVAAAFQIDLFADVVGSDRQFAAAAVDHYGEMDHARPAEVD